MRGWVRHTNLDGKDTELEFGFGVPVPALADGVTCVRFDAKIVAQWGQRGDPLPGTVIVRHDTVWSTQVSVPYDEAGVYLGAGLVLVAAREV